MEIVRRYMAGYATGFAAYLALERALMERFIARGGSPEEFCARLAPVFSRRFAPVMLGDAVRQESAPLLPSTPRLMQEHPRRAA